MESAYSFPGQTADSLADQLTRKHLKTGDVVYREGDVSGYVVTECPIEEYILLTSASPFFQGW